MSTGVGTWGDKHDEPFIGIARRPFDQEYDKSSAFEFVNRSFVRPQPWRTYPVLGGETGDELDTNPLIKEQRDKLLPNKSLNPEYNRYFDEKLTTTNKDGQVQVRDDHLALFSPKTRKVIMYDMGLKPDQGDLNRDYDNDPRYRVLGMPYFLAPNDARVTIPLGLSVLVLMRNMYLRRPYFSARPVYAGAIVGGVLFASWWKKYREERMLEKELHVWDYVRRHPEDFPEVFEKRRQYKEIFQSWRPLR